MRSLQEDLGGLGASPAPPHALGWVQGSAALLAHDQPGLQSGSHPLSCCWAVAEFSFPPPTPPSPLISFLALAELLLWFQHCSFPT